MFLGIRKPWESEWEDAAMCHEIPYWDKQSMTHKDVPESILGIPVEMSPQNYESLLLASRDQHVKYQKFR